MKLEFKSAARKRLADMPRTHARKMLEQLEAIAANPDNLHPQVTRMVGSENRYRLRVADWRAVYEVQYLDDVMLVLVIDVRGSVYR